jgi:hypothetical protein
MINNDIPTFDDIAQGLQDISDDTGLPFLNTLQELKDLKVLSQALFQGEAQRLKKKLGADHPRVRQMEARLKQNSRLIQDLEVEVEIAKIQVPEVSEQDALIHGRIVDGNNRGLSGLTVYGEDINKKELRAVGSSETNASGYYALPISADKLPQLATVKDKGIFLAIRTRSGKVVYRWPEPVPLAEGSRQVENLALNRETLTPIYKGSRPVAEKAASPEETDLDPDLWIVRGTVRDEQNQGLEGLVISLYDRDLVFDDVLGTTITDANGKFQILYRTEAFCDLFEANPDLYLKVMDQQGNTLHTSERVVRCEAGHEEVFEIDLDATSSSA